MACRRPIVLVGIALLFCSCSKPRKSAPPKRTQAVERDETASFNVIARPAFAYAAKGAKQVSLSDIAERAVRGVVNISSTQTVRRSLDPFFDQFRFFHGRPREERARSLGSGVIVSSKGVVLTNNHVVEHADRIEVVLSDGNRLKAKVVGTDPKSDLAVLKLQGDFKGLQSLPFGDSSKLRLGEVVLAIGNPFGVGQTVTLGIVSALGRANIGIVDYEDFIQTDAAINPGNSGGALVNMRGELVGINTAILSRSGGYQGIGFAIPSVMARPIMDSLLKHRRVIRGWLGVVIQELDEKMAKMLGLSSGKGVLVSDVQPGSPAAKAGIKRGDVITVLNGRPTNAVSRLRNEIAAAGSGKNVKLIIVREGMEREVGVTLGVLPGDQVARLEPSQGVLGGLTLEALTEETRRRLGFPGRGGGVIVTGVERGSAADRAGIREGDIVLEINRRPVTNASEFSAVYRRAKDRVLLVVFRRGTTMYLLLDK